MKKILFFILFCYHYSGQTQQLSVTWSRFLGNPSGGGAHSIIATPDGGYLAMGSIGADGGDAMGYHGGLFDVWLVKLNAAGNTQWQKCLGGSNDDRPSGWGNGGGALAATADGGYIVSAVSKSSDGNLTTANKGGFDLWVVKLSNTGAIQWQRSFGGAQDEIGFKIRQTADGGYLLVGGTRSNNTGDVGPSHGAMDVWTVKLNATGQLQWQKCFGSTLSDEPGGFAPSPDGGYVLALCTKGHDGDVTNNPDPGRYSFWIVKITATGDISWDKCLGGSDDDYAIDIIPAPNGYVIAGQTFSWDGDIKGGNEGLSDYWIVRIDQDGNLVWENTLGGLAYDVALTVGSTPDGGFILAGQVDAMDFDHGDITNGHGEFDAWLVKLNSNGSLAWQKCVGGSSFDWGMQALALPGDRYVLLGETTSQDGMSTNNLWPRAMSVTHFNMGAILPVRFIHFTGRRDSEDALLHWQAADTEEGGRFLVERSSDGKYFRPVASIPHGSHPYYTHRDPGALPGAGTLYYRIASEDGKGFTNYTQAITLSGRDALPATRLLGNPVSSELQLHHTSDKPGKRMLGIIDQQGKIWKAVPVRVQAGQNTIRQDVSGLPAGMYNVRLYHTGNSTPLYTAPFMKLVR